MPYVTEQASSPGEVEAQCLYLPSETLGPDYGVQVTSNIIRSQYGWRSKGEAEAAKAELASFSSSGAQWRDTARIVEAMDRVQRAMTHPVADPMHLPVHNRLYTELRFDGACDATYRCGRAPAQVPNFLFFPSVTPNVTYTASHSETDARTIGSKLMRDSRPTAPHASLGQFFGEVRDTSRMFKRSNYVPRTSKDVGGAYLNGVFGVMPFYNDLMKAAEAILHSDELLKQFALNAAKPVRRTRTHMVSQDTYKGYSAGANNTTSSFSKGPASVSIRRHLNLPYSGYNIQTHIDFSWTESIRSFCTFKYFAFDPKGVMGRLEDYRQKARYLLGLDASASVAWEVTRFSWMVDWFYDVGGLLSYQESVASDSLVASRAGLVYEIKLDCVMRHNLFKANTYYTFKSVDGKPWVTTLSFRDQTRLKGNPYNMGVNWGSLSQKQWFILGALGLSWMPGLPISE